MSFFYPCALSLPYSATASCAAAILRLCLLQSVVCAVRLCCSATLSRPAFNQLFQLQIATTLRSAIFLNIFLYQSCLQENYLQNKNFSKKRNTITLKKQLKYFLFTKYGEATLPRCVSLYIILHKKFNW